MLWGAIGGGFCTKENIFLFWENGAKEEKNKKGGLYYKKKKKKRICMRASERKWKMLLFYLGLFFYSLFFSKGTVNDERRTIN